MSYEMTEEELRDDCQYWLDRRQEKFEYLYKKTLNHLSYIRRSGKREKFSLLCKLYDFSSKEDVFKYIKTWADRIYLTCDLKFFPDVLEVVYRKAGKNLETLQRKIKN